MVKLLRTDTTLDLSQKARVVRISGTEVQGFYSLRALRTDHLGTAELLPGAGVLRFELRRFLVTEQFTYFT